MRRTLKNLILSLLLLCEVFSLCACNVRPAETAELLYTFDAEEAPLKIIPTESQWICLVGKPDDDYYTVSADPTLGDFSYVHYIDDTSIRRFTANDQVAAWSEVTEFGTSFMYYKLNDIAADFIEEGEVDQQGRSDSVGVSGNKIYTCFINADSYVVDIIEWNTDGEYRRVFKSIGYNDVIPKIVFSVNGDYMCIAVDYEYSVIRLRDRKVVGGCTLSDKIKEIKYVSYDPESGLSAILFNDGQDDMIVVTDNDGTPQATHKFPNGKSAYEDYAEIKNGALHWIEKDESAEKNEDKYEYVRLDLETGEQTHTARAFYFYITDGGTYTLRYNKDPQKIDLYLE